MAYTYFDRAGERRGKLSAVSVASRSVLTVSVAVSSVAVGSFRILFAVLALADYPGIDIRKLFIRGAVV